MTNDKTFHCGTLVYTRMGLAALFGWLLWGDFCFTLMESVVPSVMPLKLKALGCSNSLMGLIMTTAPGIIGLGMGPYISVKSDQCRSRWGRRIPFIVWTLPFLCASLVLLGWSDEISSYLYQRSDVLQRFAPTTVTIGIIAVFYTMFRFFNMFVNSVFYYLLNDVVPPQFLARFYGSFRIVGTLAGTLYQFFVFQFAETRMREVFVGAAVLYFIGFGLMCLMVREGSYDQFESGVEKPSGRWSGLKAFFRESFTEKFYLAVFTFATFSAMGGAMNTFGVFFNQEMGLSLDQIGKMGAVGQIASVVAIYFTAIFIDRWHPLRVTVYVSIFGVIHAFMPWVWTFVSLPAIVYYWLLMAWIIISQFQAGLAGACGMPLYMRVFPQSRFGQFCSAQGLFITFVSLGTSIAAGAFIDAIAFFCTDKDFAYRFIFLWSTFFGLAGAVSIGLAYRTWYRMGGDARFHPPAPWSHTGVEALPIVATVGPQTRWLMTALRGFDAIMILSVVCIPVLMFWMQRQQAMLAFWWHGAVLLPLSMLTWWWWSRVRAGTVGDMKRAVVGEMPVNGIPHHGVLLVVAAKFLLALVIWVVQVIVSVNMLNEAGAIVFTSANIIVDLLLIGAVVVISRLEKGFSTVVDRNLAEAGS